MKKLILLYAIALLFTGCATMPPSAAVTEAFGIVMDLPAITSLMSLDKGEVFEKLGSDFELVASNTGKVRQYICRERKASIYFADGLDPNKIDTMEFDGNVDINGVTIGTDYAKAKKKLPHGYVECPRASDDRQTTLEFYSDDFTVRFYVNNGTNKIDKVKVMRFITIEQIGQMIRLEKDDFISKFGEPDGIYQTGPEDSYNGHFYDLFGLSFVFGEDSPPPYSSLDNNWAVSNQYGDRVNVNGARAHMNAEEIKAAISLQPVYEGPVLIPPPGYYYGHRVTYWINGINVAFEVKTSHLENCDEIFFTIGNVRALEPLISPDEPGVFNVDDTTICGIKPGDTENDILATLGQPQGIVSDSNLQTKQYVFDFGQVDLKQIPSGEQIVTRISVTNGNCVGPRDIKIGMNYKEVMSRFHVSNDEISSKSGILYNYISGAHGFVEYNFENDEVMRLEYQYVAQQDFLVNILFFEINDGTVTKIETGYAFPTQLAQESENDEIEKKEMGYSLQQNQKMLQVGAPHPERNAQFKSALSLFGRGNR